LPNQSINQLRPICPEMQYTLAGHQGRMQPPLTGAHKKNKVSIRATNDNT